MINLNFQHWELIEINLVFFILIIISRRLIYALLKKVVDRFAGVNRKKIKVYRLLTKYLFASGLALILTLCGIFIALNHGYLAIFYISYPLVIYIFFFGFHLDHFLQISIDSGGSYINGLPMHCCSTKAETIREEIDFLKNDFNVRFKQIIFTSILNAYYGGCVHCFFVPKTVSFDFLFAIVNIASFWIGGFALGIVFCLPAKYCDILHRANCHLGQWVLTDDSGNKVNSWSKTLSYEEGTVVKYNEKYYKSVGPFKTAIPGNTSHNRFHVSFYFY